MFIFVRKCHLCHVLHLIRPELVIWLSITSCCNNNKSKRLHSVRQHHSRRMPRLRKLMPCFQLPRSTISDYCWKSMFIDFFVDFAVICRTLWGFCWIFTLTNLIRLINVNFVLLSLLTQTNTFNTQNNFCKLFDWLFTQIFFVNITNTSHKMRFWCSKDITIVKLLWLAHCKLKSIQLIHQDRTLHHHLGLSIRLGRLHSHCQHLVHRHHHRH